MPRAPSALDELLRRPVPEQEAKGYADTAREIASQPALWRKTAGTVREAYSRLASLSPGASRLVLTGAGSSFYAALGAAYALRGTFRMCEAIPSTEIVMDPDAWLPREDFLLVSFARSGESPEGNAAVSLAEQLRPGRVRHLAVTCNRAGGLGRMVSAIGERGRTLYLPEETNDRGLAMTASATSLTIAGYALAFLESADAYEGMVEGLAEAAEPLLEHGSDLALALSRDGFSRVVFIASPPFLAGAQEAHLKIHELTGGRITAKAEDALGFRHGFMGSVDASSLVVLFFSSEPYRRRYELDLLADIKAKGIGKKILVVADRCTAAELGAAGAAPADLLEYGVHRAVTDAVRSPLVALPGQLMGLFSSLALGLKPDAPSPSGVINRVVRGVRIHPFREGHEGPVGSWPAPGR